MERRSCDSCKWVAELDEMDIKYHLRAVPRGIAKCTWDPCKQGAAWIFEDGLHFDGADRIIEDFNLGSRCPVWSNKNDD